MGLDPCNQAILTKGRKGEGKERGWGGEKGRRGIEEEERVGESGR